MPDPGRGITVQLPDNTFDWAQADASGRLFSVPASGGAGGDKAFTQFTVTDAAQEILAANTSRNAATFVNNSGVTIFLGNDGALTTGNGLPLAAGAPLSDDVSTDAWFAIVATGTADIRMLEVS